MQKLHIAAGLLLLSLATSCTRENDVVEPDPAPVAGKTGKVTLNLTPRHHGANISTATLYIRYNALEYPKADNVFDDSAVVEIKNNVPVASFDSLSRGNYFIYAKGFDPSPKVNMEVVGSAPFTITDTSHVTLNAFIEVSETDGTNHTK
jgi:hypothetical protein